MSRGFIWKRKNTHGKLEPVKFQVRYQGFISQTKLHIESSLLKPTGGLVQCGESLCHVLLSLKIHYSESGPLPQAGPASPGNSKAGPSTKTQDK